VKSVPIAEAIKDYRTVEPEGTLVKTARGLGICLGDHVLSRQAHEQLGQRMAAEKKSVMPV
ncbi:MAG: hypothetical protein ABG776_10890, partial [Cyanobacteria bacterium J06555_13]